MYNINKRVKELRKYLNLSQSAFAKKLGVATSSVGNWDVNIRPVKPIHITAICNVNGFYRSNINIQCQQENHSHCKSRLRKI